MNSLVNMGHWLLARMEEPSTWAGSGVLAVAAHAYFGAAGDAAIALLAAIGGFFAVVIPEKKP
ncbi:hypothetical protein QM467_05805 [Rhodoblastus sp. 17X3]|uniref:hypothetical protein n=1 Tax=Rhodoblastus sp. 17X3 TaxID=3047026 RepID=UPI0024B6DD50|nr:hypothetical protein [Rhodoblastus sp. 17X3]MDI9847575.1 hypothetical protein [Rhodoblastus sp. 17X3]